MASLLNQRTIDGMLDIARANADRSTEILRGLFYANGSVPPGVKSLDTPEEREVYRRFIERQAQREQFGTAPGDIATALSQHPGMQQMEAGPQPDAQPTGGM